MPGPDSTISTQRRRKPRWASAEPDQGSSSQQLDERYHSRTIERALDVLETFEPNRSNLSLVDLAQTTGLPESSLFRILLTLQKRGYLQQHADGTYQLTDKVLLGRIYDDAERLRRVAHPYLEELTSQFNETSSLAYLFGEHIQVLDTVEAFHQIRVTNRRGRILPPYCSSMGKAILAFLPPHVADSMLEIYGLTHRTEHSIVDRNALRQEFERIRRGGFACDREESMLGGICFGAPIFSASGGVVAAVSVSSPAQRITPDRETAIQQSVVTAAGELTNRLRDKANG